MTTALQGGFASIDITPPLGVYLAGHFNARPSNGIHDPLTAQIIVLQLGEQRLALIGCDLLGVPAELTALVRERVQELVGIEPEHVMLWATHTHAGPVLSQGSSEPRDEEYFRVLARRLAGGVAAAVREMREVTLRIGWGSESRIAYNRRYRLKNGSVRTNPGVGNPDIARVDGPSDPTVGALFIDDANGLQAVLVNFACHLDVLGNGNFLYSADYPYSMRAMLQSAFGRKLVIPFANGACGNINHINVFASKRQGGYDHARMMGMLLAGEVLKIEGRAEALTVHDLCGKSNLLDLPRRPYTPEEIAEFKAILADERIADRAYPKIRARTHLAQHEAGRAVSAVEVQALKVGGLAFFGIPGEYFVEYGLQLRERSSVEHSFVVELANDSIGYIPTPEAFDEGGYEGTSARFTRDTGQVLADAVLELLNA